MQSLCIVLFINKYIPTKTEGVIMDMKRRSYTFKYFLIPEFGNLTLIRAMAVISFFFSGFHSLECKVNLTAKHRIVIVLEIRG